jgi:hypothetical protein
MKVSTSRASRFAVSSSSCFVEPTDSSKKGDDQLENDNSLGSKVGEQQKQQQQHQLNTANVVAKMGMGLVDTYKSCNPEYMVNSTIQKRVLTNPPEPSHLNDGHDNVESNLICRVYDRLEYVDSAGVMQKFTVLDLLGIGTFGQVFRCQKMDGSKDLVAIKVIKNKPAYRTQGMLEINILRLLNAQQTDEPNRHLVQLQESFECKGHICLVFELLSITLLDILTQNHFRGLSMSIVQSFTSQILSAMVALEDVNIIHCDLKPENILLVPAKTHCSNSSSSSNNNSNNNSNATSTMSAASIDEAGDAASTTALSGGSSQKTNSGSSSLSRTEIKVIDFGSACFEGRIMYSYIQSRFCKS